MTKQREARKVSIKDLTLFQAWKLLILSTWKFFSVWLAVTPEISLTMTETATPKCQFILCVWLEPSTNVEGGHYDGDDDNHYQR
jgi:hypothetical protein